jgi:aryl-alcohol dehydrogenase-like predicted oxidoreductase
MRDVSSVILGVKNRKELIECIEAEERGTLSQVEIQQIENCIKES